MKYQSYRTGTSFLRSESGNFLTELTLAFPTLFLVLVGTVDLSFGMLMYVQASRVAYEAARFGSSLPGLPASYDATRDVCSQNSISLDPQTQQIVNRAKTIMADARLFFSTPNEVGYSVSHDLQNRQINVCLSLEWRSIIPGLAFSLARSNIRASATAPYLFHAS